MTLTSYLYSTSYDPPAPVVKITVYSPDQIKPEVSFTALADYGADVTMIPRDVLKKIGARYAETRRLRGISGLGYPVKLYSVTVRIARHTIYGIRAVAIEPKSEPLIGRDVLNQLVVTLDGPATTTEVKG